MSTVIQEAVNITATVMSEGIVYIYDTGGNVGLALLAFIGIFAILSSVIRDSGKTLGVLFIVCIAAPFLLIEHLWKKAKSKEDELNGKRD